jgi:hypothetical protein
MCQVIDMEYEKLEKYGIIEEWGGVLSLLKFFFDF